MCGTGDGGLQVALQPAVDVGDGSYDVGDRAVDRCLFVGWAAHRSLDRSDGAEMSFGRVFPPVAVCVAATMAVLLVAAMLLVEPTKPLAGRRDGALLYEHVARYLSRVVRGIQPPNTPTRESPFGSTSQPTRATSHALRTKGAGGGADAIFLVVHAYLSGYAQEQRQAYEHRRSTWRQRLGGV